MAKFIVASREEGKFGLAIEIVEAPDDRSALLARLEVLHPGLAKAMGVGADSFETAQALIEKIEHDHGQKLGVLAL